MILSKKYPLDILVCLIIMSLFLILFYRTNSPYMYISGILFLFFVPGFLFILLLFPSIKSNKQLRISERILLSIIFSIALSSLVGIGLNFTRMGISYHSISISIIVLSVILAIMAYARWQLTDQAYRFSLIDHLVKTLRKHRSTSPLAYIHLIVVMITLLFFLAAIFSFIMTPRQTQERFTEFYILNQDGYAYDYPKQLLINQTYPIIMGLSNYEQKPMNYTIQIWLINQSMLSSSQSTENMVTYHNVWYIDGLTISLNASSVHTNGFNPTQWTYKYPITLQHKGTHLKLLFLLFNTTTVVDPELVTTNTFHDDVFLHAYRTLHLWVTVT